MSEINPADLWNAILEGHRLLQLAEAKRVRNEDLEADFLEELRADARDLDRVERNEQEEARWPR